MTSHTTTELCPGRVTVVVVAYRHAEFVEQCLDSAYAQTYPDVRVVIFDDASPDDSADVIRAYLDRKGVEATFVAHEVNRGLCATLNEATALVDSEYVAFISADDWMEPNRFEVQVTELAGRGPEFGHVYSDMYQASLDGTRLPSTYLEEYFASCLPGHTPPDGDAFLDQLAFPYWPTPSLLYRTSALLDAGPFDESLRFEDYDMLLRILRGSKVAYSPIPVVTYRRTPGSLLASIYDDIVGLGAAYSYILRKHLGVSAEADRIIGRRVGTYAKESYLRGGAPSDVRPDLALAWRWDRKPSTAVYLAATTARVPGTWLGSAVSFVRALKSRRGRGRLGTQGPSTRR